MAKPPETSSGSAQERAPERAQAEELAAWAVQYGPALRRYFARRTGGGDADDLVQEVFLRLQAKRTGPEGAELLNNVEGYLFTIAKHVLINRYHSAANRNAALNDGPDDLARVPDDISPERILDAKQEYARAVVAILSLPPRTRTAFELHRFDKLSYAAIAERMGISKRSVQDLMERAIRKLSQEMRKGS